MDFRLKFDEGKQKGLLLELKEALGLSQEELAARLDVSRRCLRNWISETRTLPKNVFSKAVSWCPDLRRFTTNIKEVLPSNWGGKKGGKSRYEQLLRTGTFVAHHKLMLTKRREISKMRRVRLPSTSKFYKEVRSENVSSLSLLATLILTDGYLQKRGVVGYTSIDPVLMNVFIDLARANSRKLPNLLQTDDGRLEAYVFDRELVRELLNLSPSYKKSPSNKTGKKEYLDELQPTVDFLLKTDVRTRIYSIRLAMSADGCITVHNSMNGRMTASLIFGCANPTLLNGWKKVFSSLGIEMRVIKAKVKWAGVGGLITSKKEVLYRFWKLGGFVDGVKITRKSPNFAGVEKNALLNRFLKAKHIID